MEDQLIPIVFLGQPLDLIRAACSSMPMGAGVKRIERMTELIGHRPVRVGTTVLTGAGRLADINLAVEEAEEVEGSSQTTRSLSLCAKSEYYCIAVES